MILISRASQERADIEIEDERTTETIEMIEMIEIKIKDQQEMRDNTEKPGQELNKDNPEEKRDLTFEKETKRCTDRESENEGKENNKEKEKDKNNKRKEKEKDSDNKRGRDKRKPVFVLSKEKATNINATTARLLNSLLQKGIEPNTSKMQLRKIQLIRTLLRLRTSTQERRICPSSEK